MPPPLPKGEVLTDAIKKGQWVIGASIGKGGFGEIYLADKHGSSSAANAQFVIKIVSRKSKLCMHANYILKYSGTS